MMHHYCICDIPTGDDAVESSQLCLETTAAVYIFKGLRVLLRTDLKIVETTSARHRTT